jgi:hypothetical protein
MTRLDNLNFSTDLLRISNWIYSGQDNLAEKFINICDKKYQVSNKYKYLYVMIKRWKENRYRGADAATTLSRLII